MEPSFRVPICKGKDDGRAAQESQARRRQPPYGGHDRCLAIVETATPKTPKREIEAAFLKRWLARNPRCKLHFTPTSCSWLNMVERLFAEIICHRIRRVRSTMLPNGGAIIEWVNYRNHHPKPFVWTAKANPIIAKHLRARKALANLSNRMQMSKSEHYDSRPAHRLESP